MTLKAMIAAAALALVAALPAAAQELKFANFAAPSHTVTGTIIEKMNAEVSAATGGSVLVKGFHGGELGSGPAEQYVRVLQGAADMAWGLPGYTSSQFPQTMIVELPGVLPPGKAGYDALWDAFDAHLAGEFPGVVPVALWTSEPNIIIMRDKVVRSPADLEGMKMRVAGATAGRIAEALGGTPVQMPISQVYNALQTGLVDGVITSGTTLSTFNLDEVASAYTLGAPLGRLSFFAVMNEGVYEGLSESARAAVDAAKGRELSRSAEEGYFAEGDAAIEAARSAGDNTFVDLSEAEVAAFAEALSTVTQAYVDEVGGEATRAAMQK